jgi:protein-ribulosamine 3-kinase
MEDLLKRELESSTCRRWGERQGGGCISDGQSYELDGGRKIFVKSNSDAKAKLMFDGEYAGLEKIQKTKAICVPAPIKVFPQVTNEGWMFAMEHLDISSPATYMQELGTQLAQLHLHNAKLLDSANDGSIHVKEHGGTDMFGFECVTCCGFIPMPNEWTSDWIDFYARQRLQPQIDLLTEKQGDRQLIELWSHLQLKIPQFFKGIDNIRPSLLHGDLWSGNVGATRDGPVIFDPAALYGHHEFELSIADIFHGFSDAFYTSYHRLIPKSSGYQTRLKLYKLFHYLNHWNHFGSGYRSTSIAIMKELNNY